MREREWTNGPAANPATPEPARFDGWLVAVRAFACLVLGMLAISFATVI